MNIFLQELRSYRKSTLVWACSLSVLAVVFLSMFPAFTKDVESSRKLLANLPEAVRAALDISLQNFFTIYGFFAYLFSFVALAGAVQAMNMGVSLISKEFSGKTADYLLSKPVSRSTVVSGKILAGVALLAVTNAVFSASALVAAHIANTEAFSNRIFLLISGTLFLIQVFFLALGVLFSLIIPKIKSVVSVSLPTVFTFFIIGTLGAIVGNDNVRYITPFKFFDPQFIIENRRYEWRFLILELICVTSAVAYSYYTFQKKDIRAAS